MQHTLSINQLALLVHLGVGDAERLHAQPVLLTATMQFDHPLSACESDNIDDTICYDTLSQTLQVVCDEKPYHLIEHLANCLFNAIKSRLPANTRLKVILEKPHPTKSIMNCTYEINEASRA